MFTVCSIDCKSKFNTVKQFQDLYLESEMLSRDESYGYSYFDFCDERKLTKADEDYYDNDTMHEECQEQEIQLGGGESSSS